MLRHQLFNKYMYKERIVGQRIDGKASAGPAHATGFRSLSLTP